MASGTLSLTAAKKLVDAGLTLNLYSYPLAVEKILGKKARWVIDVAISLTQFSFTIAHIAFLLETS